MDEDAFEQDDEIDAQPEQLLKPSTQSDEVYIRDLPLEEGGFDDDFQ